MNGVPSELALRWVEFPFTDPGIICRECCACGRQHGDRDDQQITMTHEIFSCPAVFSGGGRGSTATSVSGVGKEGPTDVRENPAGGCAQQEVNGKRYFE